MNKLCEECINDCKQADGVAILNCNYTRRLTEEEHLEEGKDFHTYFFLNSYQK